MAGLLDIALSGIQAYRQSLVVAGENLANANTEGYHRRSADLQELPALSSGVTSVTTLSGFGVRVDGVDRAFDEFLSDDQRQAQSNFSRFESYSSSLGRLENLLLPLGQNVTTAVTDFFSAFHKLTDDPASLGTREIVLEKGKNLSSVIKTTALETEKTKSQSFDRGKILADVVNGATFELAQLNTQLRKGQNNSLLDKRDSLLASLSEEIDFTVDYGTNGVANVRLGLSGAGPILVNNTTQTKIGVNATGERLAVLYDPAGQNKTTQQITGGRIKAEVDLYDRASSVLDSFDVLANLITENFNNIHSSGRDVDGNLGKNMFTNNTLVAYQGAANRGDSGLEITITDSAKLPKGSLTARYVSTAVTAKLATTSTAIGELSITNAESLLDGTYTVSYLGTNDLWELKGPGIDGSVITSNKLVGPGFSFLITGKPKQGDSFSIVPLSDKSGGFWKVDGPGITTESQGVENISLEGLDLQFTGQPKSGDIFTLSPRSGSAQSLEFNIDNARELAAAGDKLVYSDANNTSFTEVFGEYNVLKTPDALPDTTSIGGVDFEPFSITNSTAVSSAFSVPSGTKDFSLAGLYKESSITLEQSVAPANGDIYDITLNDGGANNITVLVSPLSGYSAGTAQVSKLTLAGTIAPTDVLSINIDGVSFSRTIPGSISTISAATTDFVNAINASSLSTRVTAASSSSGIITLTGDAAGEGFTLSTSVSNASGGTAPTLNPSTQSAYTPKVKENAGPQGIYTAFQALSETAKSGYQMRLDGGSLTIFRSDGINFGANMAPGAAANAGALKENIKAGTLTSTVVQTTDGVAATNFHVFNRDGIRLSGRSLDESSYNTLFNGVFSKTNGFFNEVPKYNGFLKGDTTFLNMDITAGNLSETEDKYIEFRVGEFYNPLTPDAVEKKTVRVYEKSLNSVIASFNLDDTQTFSLGGARNYTFPSTYSYTGSTRSALARATDPPSNTTASSNDVAITGNGVTRTVDVATGDSAKRVAAAINVETSLTGVTATAKTYAKLLSTATSSNYSLKINGVSTSTFSISSSSVRDAVEKINQISGTTGVTANASTDGRFVTLYDADGDDITIEKTSGGANLDVYAIGYDGTTVDSTKVDLTPSNGTLDSTTVIGTIQTSSASAFSVTQSGSASTGYFASGSSTLTVGPDAIPGAVFSATLDKPISVLPGYASSQDIFKINGNLLEDLIVVVEPGGTRTFASQNSGTIADGEIKKRELRVDIGGSVGSETASVFDIETETYLGVFDLQKSLAVDVQGWRIELDRMPVAGDKFFATNNDAVIPFPLTSPIAKIVSLLSAFNKSK